MDSCGNLVHVVVLQRTASNCFKVRSARAARLFFLNRPIKFLICGVVDAVDGSLMVSYGCNCSGELVLICIENRMNASVFRDIWARVMFLKLSKLHKPQSSSI